MSRLIKIIGRTAVTKYREETYDVWVEPTPTIPTPPSTPPVGTTPPSGSGISVTPGVLGLEPCTTGGVDGVRVVFLNADGSITRSACMTGSFGVGI